MYWFCFVLFLVGKWKRKLEDMWIKLSNVYNFRQFSFVYKQMENVLLIIRHTHPFSWSFATHFLFLHLLFININYRLFMLYVRKLTLQESSKRSDHLGNILFHYTSRSIAHGPYKEKKYHMFPRRWCIFFKQHTHTQKMKRKQNKKNII